MSSFNDTAYDLGNGSLIVHQSPPYDMEEFLDLSLTQEHTTVGKIVMDVLLATGILFGIVYLLILSTLLQEDVREDHRVWHFYHLVALQFYINVTVYPITNRLLNSTTFIPLGLCYFINYSIDYSLMAIGWTLVNTNIDFLFAVVFPIKIWQANRCFRFVTTTLVTWLCVCMFVSHVIINNNRIEPGAHCYHIGAKAMIARDLFQWLLPGCVCLLSLIIIIIAHALKHCPSRSTSADISDISIADDSGQTQWAKAVLTLNGVFIVSTLIELFSMLAYDSVWGVNLTRQGIAFLAVYHVMRGISFFLVSISMLCFETVRNGIKFNCVKVVRFVTKGKINFDEDEMDLAVHYSDTTCE